MVNAAKRMRALTDKIHKVKVGPGAVQLPSDKAAQLRRIYLRVPTGTYPQKEWFWGARLFWHKELARLKYWNPDLQTQVDTIHNTTPEGADPDPLYLTVDYESTSRDALAALKSTPYPKPQLKIKPRANNKSENQAQAAALRNDAQLHSTATKLGVPNPVTAKTPMRSMTSLEPIQLTPEVAAHAPSDEIKIKAQPAADASSPQTTSPPQTVYTRTLTLPLAGLRHHEIWNWIRRHTGLKDHMMNAEQKASEAEMRKLAAFKVNARKDKKLVKAGMDAMRKEEAELKKAREAAERMAADNM